MPKRRQTKSLTSQLMVTCGHDRGRAFAVAAYISLLCRPGPEVPKRDNCPPDYFQRLLFVEDFVPFVEMFLGLSEQVGRVALNHNTLDHVILFDAVDHVLILRGHNFSKH